MSKLDEHLLDRIKNDITLPFRRVSSTNECLNDRNLWPEVCRRYAEEVTRNEYAIALAEVRVKHEKQISQLKKQLDEYRNELAKAMSRSAEYKAIAESKLEVKEKPDFFKFIEHRKFDDKTSNAYVLGCEKIWNEHVIHLYAAIAERDEKIKELERLQSESWGLWHRQNEKIKELKNDLETERTTGRQEWERLQLDKVSKLESELNQAKELLQRCIGEIPELLLSEVVAFLNHRQTQS